MSIRCSEKRCLFTMRFWHKPYLVISILLVFLFSLLLPSCQSALTAESTVQPDNHDTICQSAAQGGNLHYQNLVLAIGDQIVFNSADGQLSLADANGQSCQPLLNETVAFPAYDGSRLFYTSSSTEGALAKISLDGTNQVRIGQTALKYLICEENWLYAIDRSSGNTIRLKKDGTGRTILDNHQAVALALADNKLYISGSEAANGLLCMDLASGECELLYRDLISSLNISGKWLYFSTLADGYRLHAWSADHFESTICQLSFDKPFIVSEDHLYFIHSADMNRLYRLPLNGMEKLDDLIPEMIVDDWVDAFVVCGDYIYYRRPSSTRIYRVSTQDRSIIRIT